MRHWVRRAFGEQGIRWMGIAAGGLTRRASRQALIPGTVCVVVALAGTASASAATFVWSEPDSLETSVNGSFAGLHAVSCPAATQCTAVDATGQELTFDPLDPTKAVSVHTVDASVQIGAGLADISCPSTTQCTADMANNGVVTFNPTSSTPNSTVHSLTTDFGTEGLSCPTTTQCTTVSGTEEMTFNPQSAAPTDTPVTVGNSLRYVACPSATQCTAVDAYGAAVSFNPQSGASIGYELSAVCAAGSPCSNGLACPTAAQCTVIGYNNETTFDPTSASHSTTAYSLDGVGPSGRDIAPLLACPSTTECTAVGDSHAETFNPQSAPPNGTAVTAESGATLLGVDCPSVDVCVAVDTNGFAVTERNSAAFANPSLSAGAPSSGPESTPISASALSATLSGGSSPGGTITWRVSGPSASPPTPCGGGWQTIGTATASGDGTYHPSGGFTPVTGPGNYWWYASYTGDDNNNPEHSTCGATMTKTVVGPALPVSAPDIGTEGVTIPASSLSATLSDASSPGGTITWSVYGPSATAPTSCSGWHVVGTATVSGNGTYHPSAGLTPIWGGGEYWWYATYSGDAQNGASNSTCGAGMAKTEVDFPTAVSLSVPSSGNEGSTISSSAVSAVVSGWSASCAGPCGSVTFRVFGPQATAPTSCDSSWEWVGQVPVTANGTYHPGYYSEQSPTTFTPATGTGKYWWYVSYNGDGSNAASSSPCGPGMPETTVGPAATSLSLSAPSSGAAGAAISASGVSAVLSKGFGTPGGTVTFTVFGPQPSAPTDCSSGGTTVGTATVTGNATYHPSSPFTPTAAGDYWWYARYDGDANNASSSAACGAAMAETTISGSTSLSVSAPSSGAVGTAISASGVSAALSGGFGTPGGTVTFTVFGPQPSAPTDCSSGGRTVGIATVTGNATYHPTFPFTPTAAGDYWWYARYGGDANNTSSSSACGAAMAETTISAAGGSGGTSGSALLGKTAVSGTTITMPVRCSTSGPCRLQFKLVVVETIRTGRIIAIAARQKTKHRTVTIGQASAEINAGGQARVPIRLNRTGRALLKHHSPLHALLIMTASGKTVAKKKVTIGGVRHIARRATVR